MGRYVTVIGGTNIDIAAGLTAPFVPADSVPGQVTLGCGGVARNIAHNLLLMGHEVRLVSIFGEETFGDMCWRECQAIGLDLTMSERSKEMRTGIYLCINNHSGEMIAAVADTEIVNIITPEWLERRMGDINLSDFVVADTNISENAIRFLMDNTTVPLLIDGVSSTKAHRVMNALTNAKLPYLHSLKLNLKEATAITGEASYALAAQRLIDLGVQYVYITLGSEGVYCRNAAEEWLYPALPLTEVANTTGAGDAFLAGVVYALSKGLAFPQTAQYGLMAARATLMSPKAVNPDIANILL